MNTEAATKINNLLTEIRDGMKFSMRMVGAGNIVRDSDARHLATLAQTALVEAENVTDAGDRARIHGRSKFLKSLATYYDRDGLTWTITRLSDLAHATQ